MADINYTPEQINQMVQPLFDIMQDRVPAEDMALMHRAFELANKAHATQKRKTGEPYIIHPIAVARIVGEEMCLGTNPICAAFLHDVVEDTAYTIVDIERIFGKDIAHLVDVVTKTKKATYQTSKQVDNFKQMLDSLQYDIRALLIKLADRLHNMRTLSSMRPDKQMKIAGETDYFYAPLANRLGLYRIKIELENLSFKYRCPREFATLEKLLEENKAVNQPVLDRFMARINDKLIANGINAQIESDYRQPFSIRRKMIKKGCDFRHVSHKNFVRIVFDENCGYNEKHMALRIYALLADEFNEKPGSFLNYIDAPKENGYQSLHVKLQADNGKWVEVHISSQRMRRKSRLGCIAEREEGNISHWIDKFRSTLQDIATHNHEIGYMEGVTTSFYNDDITVYTPKGQAVNLPQKSTALDFAFEIHTNIGMHAQWARIDGQLCSVKTELKRGDCIEIGTHDSITPQPDWLDHVLTYKARRNISSYLKGRPAPPFKRCEYCHPIPGDEVVGFKEDDGTLVVHKRDCRKVISQASQKGDAVMAINFTPKPDVLYHVSVHVKAIDRYHLLSDLIDCITNQQKLSITRLQTDTVDQIVDCEIEFAVHSYDELNTVIKAISSITNVEEVTHREG